MKVIHTAIWQANSEGYSINIVFPSLSQTRSLTRSDRRVNIVHGEISKTFITELNVSGSTVYRVVAPACS